MNLKRWLVEITIKQYIHLENEKDRVFHFYEITAINDIAARFKAMDIFEKDVKVLPNLKKRFDTLHLPINNYCASSAVMI